MQGGELDWGADKEHRFVLHGGQDDFVRRADAIDVGRAIRDAEIAGIHHPQVNVQRLPELPGAPRAGLRAALAAGISPPPADALAALKVLPAIFVQPPDVRLEPGIEDGDPHALEELADPVAPARLLFRRAGRHKIHRPGKIDPRSAQ